MRKRPNSLIGIVFLAVAFIACGVEAGHPLGGSSATGGASGGGTGSSDLSGAEPNGSSASGATLGNNGGLQLTDASISTTATVDSSATDAFVGCAATTVQAKQLPLDVLVLLDTSFSMDDLVEPALSKWQSVTAAINAFATDPGSAGIAVGLQYFPGTAPGIPASCTSSAQCAAAGPCELNFCEVNAAGVYFCNTDADCVFCDARGLCATYPCAPAGECHNSHDIVCQPGTACGPDSNGFDLGTCDALTSAACVASDDCAAQDYQNLAVPLAPLPGNAAAIATSLAGHEPGGNTPTEAALTGVFAGARAYATAHPVDTVVVVLATDGQPDEIADTTGQCAAPASSAAAQAQVAQIAANGLSGTPSIKTFGIGVFTPGDLASGTATLNQLAAAGGTTAPFIIGTATAMGNTEQQFSAALTAIRGTSLPCSYQVPVPATGTPDFSKINVRWTSAAGTATTVPYVESAAACDPNVGGWYYNDNPAEGGTPTTIEMCSVSCTALKAGSGRVDILLGCETQTLIPR